MADEDEVVPFTLGQRRRTDRLERAMFGYADEGGVLIPGLLQTVHDWQQDERRYREEDLKKQTARERETTKRVKIATNIGKALLAIAGLNLAKFYGVVDWIGSFLPHAGRH